MHSSVQKAIFLSTDKAVYPINAMGMTKALMEKLVRSSDYRSNTSCSITRYGNVIGSRGSVIPYFFKALKSGKDVTITNPDMTRFIMSLSESVELVMFALERGNRGDLFIQKSPAATVETILFAVADLLKIKNPPVKIVGIRAGEKIHETLLNSEEKSLAEDFGKYFRVASVGSDSNILASNSKDFNDYSSNNTKLLSRSELRDLLSYNSEILDLIKN
jgi:UDP-glucose 4-epimerase